MSKESLKQLHSYKTVAFFSGFPDRRFTDEIAGG